MTFYPSTHYEPNRPNRFSAFPASSSFDDDPDFEPVDHITVSALTRVIGSLPLQATLQSADFDDSTIALADKWVAWAHPGRRPTIHVLDLYTWDRPRQPHEDILLCESRRSTVGLEDEELRYMGQYDDGFHALGQASAAVLLDILEPGCFLVMSRDA